MVKNAFIFPGQGSQYPGMGLGFYGSYPACRAIVEEASSILGYDLREKLEKATQEQIMQTSFTQPAIFTVNAVCMQAAREKGILPAVTAGHSLGEYSAFYCAGLFSFQEGLRLVRKRGEIMEDISARVPGGMAAIVGLESDIIDRVCRELSSQGVVQAVNYNAPGQTVIAGEEGPLASAMEALLKKGAKRAIKLNVSGPFHSSLFSEASERIKQELQGLQLNDPNIPVVCNYSAGLVKDKEEAFRALVAQVKSPVLWVDSVRNMIDYGVSAFFEIGPSKVLTNLNKRIEKGFPSVHVEDDKSLAEALDLANKGEQG